MTSALPPSTAIAVPAPLILIVDDVPEDRSTLRRYLTRDCVPAYRLAEAPTLAKALELVKVEPPDCVILDFNLPDGDGITLLRRLTALRPVQACGVIMLTGSGDASIAVQAMKAGAHDYVEKNNLSAGGLRRAVANAMEKAAFQRQLAIQARELAKKNDELASHVAKLEQGMKERAETQAALAESEAFLQSIINSNTDCVKVLDLDGRVTWMNENGKAMMEIPDFGKVCGTGWHQLWPKDGDQQGNVQKAVRLALSGQVGRFTGFCPTALGTPKWWDVIVTPIFGASHKPEKLLAVSRDISKTRLAEQIVQETAAQLRAVTDHVPISIAQFDRDYRYRFANQHFAERFGLTPETIVGKTIQEVVGEDAFRNYRPKMDEALGGKQVNFETASTYPGQTERWYSVTYIPERKAGKVVGFVAVSADITDRKHAETEIARARDEAVDATRARDKFLAALSHELRTPLNPVLLVASEAAENLSLSAAVRDDFTSIRDHVELEARLIDDLLDLSRISHGKLKLERRRLGLHSVLQNAIATVKPEIDAKNITFRVALASEEPLVNADSVRLQQVVWNILKNAVKFTPAGGHVSLESGGDTARRVAWVRVTDSGIGMSASELPRIFDAFSQGEHSAHGSVHRFGGLGLGLAITRMLVEAHGGTISAESAGANKGSVFMIELPLAQRATASGTPFVTNDKDDARGTVSAMGALGGAPLAPIDTRRPETAAVGGTGIGIPSSGGMGPNGVGISATGGSSGVAISKPATRGRILLIEDHAPTRASLSAVLGRRGFHVVVAATVAEALAAAKSHELDLIISDIGLPDGDGYQCMQMIQQIRPGLPGIALSGYGMEEDIVKSRQVGFSEHLIKPVNVNALDRAVAKVLGGGAEARAVETAGA